MRIPAILTVAAALIFFIPGCSGGGVDKDALKEYLLKLDTLRLTDLEESAVSAFTAVSGKKKKSDKALYQALTGCTLPKYTEFYTRLVQIRPATTILSNLHFTYTEGARYQLLAFSNISQYMINQEPASLRHYNELSRHASILMDRWQKELSRVVGSTND